MKIYLKKNEERRINAGHLWVYSNEIDTTRSPLKNLAPGEVVEIYSAREKFLALGYANPHALIAIRILTKTPMDIDADFFVNKIAAAFSLRKSFFAKPFYRLVYGESDQLPGLIIDRYDQIFVVQTNTAGMERLKEVIISALINLFQPTGILLKNDSSMRQIEGLENYVDVAYGEIPPDILIEENHCQFTIPIRSSQKTGWFYDHRENRSRLAKYVVGKKVVDAFCYLGAWGIEAAHYGASEVLCIDGSATAIQKVKENAKINHCEDRVECIEGDLFDVFKKLVHEKKKFDVVILDPPALIKRRKDIEQGTIAYLRLNELAMQLLNEDGVLVSCSCSLHMSQSELLDILRRASIKTQKSTQILEIGFQGLDHPIHPAIPETAYLKAYFCLVRASQ
ncbi:MAG: class I SAM-dependent rRNA methyltransferase [Gammaproteobacteria bacterium]|nr:class I SAM-dependent rRNA methyltransferase [Gammaproteobacteria bacterium]